MTVERLTWKEIEDRFDQQYVELIDYEWPAGDYCPKSGVVRTHSADKKDFYRQCKREPLPLDSAILFAGKKSLAKDGVHFSPNLLRFTICEK